jgi:3-amino-4-hydroxybenzoic acid synthase
VKAAWIDLRTIPSDQREAVTDAAIHSRVEAIVDDNAEALSGLPNTVKRVAPSPGLSAAAPDDDLITLHTVTSPRELSALRTRYQEGDQHIAAAIEVADDSTLALACESAMSLPHTVVQFRDPTKIPLEIVIAAADRSTGQLICQAQDLEEAKIIIDVLEKGADGVLLTPQSTDDVFSLAALMRPSTPKLTLASLTITETSHVGLGDRVCVDTCTHLDQDEGILVGSFAHGFILCCSETHPLPYMPTRPFRVNAGALHSYVLGLDNHTRYLSELTSGSEVLAVGTDGRTRRVVVGRSKLESRPLLEIRARSDNGDQVNLIVQDDWHVRVLGPGQAVLNVTELKPGDQVLGYVMSDKRHVGWPVEEFCMER